MLEKTSDAQGKVAALAADLSGRSNLAETAAGPLIIASTVSVSAVAPDHIWIIHRPTTKTTSGLAATVRRMGRC